MASRICCKTLFISVVGVKKKLRRLSSMGTLPCVSINSGQNGILRPGEAYFSGFLHIT